MKHTKICSAMLLVLHVLACAAGIDKKTMKLTQMPAPMFRKMLTANEAENEKIQELTSIAIDFQHAVLYDSYMPPALEIEIPTIEHQIISGGQCGRQDIICMSNEALIELNKIRAGIGAPPLNPGTFSQLENAVWYSKKQSGMGYIVHQDLRNTPLGCGSFFSGENLAQNWAGVPSGPTTAAQKCVQQFKASPPHYKNLVSTYHKYVVMGISIDPNGKVWCTQTFAVHTKFGSGKCAAVGTLGGPGEAPPGTQGIPTQKHHIKKQVPANDVLPPDSANSQSQDNLPVKKQTHSTLADKISNTKVCGREDSICMSQVALNEVNKIRAGIGAPPYSSGTTSQLENAVWYSKKLAGTGYIVHQDLLKTPLGCGSFFSGENIAQNWMTKQSGPTNAAQKCVQQLKGSPPHYKNIVSTYHNYVVMGVFIEPSGKVWCTQTFAVHTKFGSGKCAAVGTSEGSDAVPPETQSGPRQQDYIRKQAPANDDLPPISPASEQEQRMPDTKSARSSKPRMWQEGGTCGPSDLMCLSEAARNIVNQIRMSLGISPLKACSISQLDNAVWYSKKMARAGVLNHQNLETTSLGCGSFFSGENIAQNWVQNAGIPSNAARLCVEQLKKSPPHYKILISSYHQYVAMGIYIEPSGKIWCTQTFAASTNLGTGKCAAIKSIVSPGTEPLTDSPGFNHRLNGTSSTGHRFKNISFLAKLSDGTHVTSTLECGAQCRYCFIYKGKRICLSENYSVAIDKQLVM